jgi:hypothetical protein
MSARSFYSPNEAAAAPASAIPGSRPVDSRKPAQKHARNNKAVAASSLKKKNKRARETAPGKPCHLQGMWRDSLLLILQFLSSASRILLGRTNHYQDANSGGQASRDVSGCAGCNQAGSNGGRW